MTFVIKPSVFHLWEGVLNLPHHLEWRRTWSLCPSPQVFKFLKLTGFLQRTVKKTQGLLSPKEEPGCQLSKEFSLLRRGGKKNQIKGHFQTHPDPSAFPQEEHRLVWGQKSHLYQSVFLWYEVKRVTSTNLFFSTKWAESSVQLLAAQLLVSEGRWDDFHLGPHKSPTLQNTFARKQNPICPTGSWNNKLMGLRGLYLPLWKVSTWPLRILHTSVHLFF